MADESIAQQTCNQCGQQKPTADFWAQNTRQRRYPKCKACSNANALERERWSTLGLVKPKPSNGLCPLLQRECIRCKQIKPASEFYKMPKRGKIPRRCRPCYYVHDESYYAPAPPTKQCSNCGEVKLIDEFMRDWRWKATWQNRCTPCIQASHRVYHQSEHAKTKRKEQWQRKVARGDVRKDYLATKYKLTPDEYDDLLVRQGGRCALCLPDDPIKTLVIDHCHETGVVRGLLCVRHNLALGALGDSLERVERARNYLQRYPHKS